jgi:S-methylmethionine-dependent homocysteine/selenocysteine methylase
MNQTDNETYQEYLARLAKVAETLTQDQIDACAMVMGGCGCGWNKEKIIQALLY